MSQNCRSQNLPMGLYMELESAKDSRQVVSPKTVLRSSRNPGRIENRISKRKSGHTADVPRVDRGFYEKSLSIPSKCGLDGEKVLKRGSVYQSSKEVWKLKELRSLNERRKVKHSFSNNFSVPFRVADALDSLDEESTDSELEKPPVKSWSSSLTKMSADHLCGHPCPSNFLEFSFPSVSSPTSASEKGVSSNGFFEIVLDLDKRESPETVDRDLIKNPACRCEPVACPLNVGNDHLDLKPVANFQKSLSANVRMHHSPSPSESECSRDSPRSRFRPIREIFDPFMKSKSERSSHSSTVGTDEVTSPTSTGRNRRNKTLRKSLLKDFSYMRPHIEPVSKGDHHSDVLWSPAHLQGYLKLDYRHGTPSFEFSVKCPEETYVAKTWKADSAYSWSYTFHSDHGKISSASARHSRGSSKTTSMVGQMQVSCYLCSEIKHDRDLDSSLVTEFVLYDIAHARKSCNARESADCSPESDTVSTGFKGCSDRATARQHAVMDSPEAEAPQNHAFEDANINPSTSYPWLQADLHPNREVAAIVFQVPIENKERTKSNRGDKATHRKKTSLFDTPVEQKKEHFNSRSRPIKVKVITPSGTHGLPTSESRGPSTLLDRWRLGGGCDCGGWDMACPLIVFDNTSHEHCSLAKNQKPLQLFIQGAKDKIPALSLKLIEEGKYAVDFHAQLSTLQAFSICVAMLHGAEASTALGQERNRQVLQSNPPKVIVEEEMKFLNYSVTGEEKNKTTTRVQRTTPSFIVNPPFSPIARV